MKENIETEITFKPGSRPQLPMGSGYAPHLVAKGEQTWLGVRFVDFPADAQFGVPCRVTVELLYPDKLDYDILNSGAEFAVHEGPNIVATGRVLRTK